MDSLSRGLSRAAVTGDVQDQARALAARARGVSELFDGCWAKGCRDGVMHINVDDGATVREHTSTCSICNGTGKVRIPWQARLELAAYLGHLAARELYCGAALPNHSAPRRVILAFSPPKEFVKFVKGLSRWPPSVLVRAAIAAARAVLDRKHRPFNRMLTRETQESTRRAIDAAQAWVDCPCERHRKVWASLRFPAAYPNSVDWLPITTTTRPNGFAGVLQGHTNKNAILAAACETSPETVRAAIRADLLAWVRP